MMPVMPRRIRVCHLTSSSTSLPTTRLPNQTARKVRMTTMISPPMVISTDASLAASGMEFSETDPRLFWVWVIPPLEGVAVGVGGDAVGDGTADAGADGLACAKAGVAMAGNDNARVIAMPAPPRSRR